MALTKAQMEVKIEELEKTVSSMTNRTGCPKGFMPVYKLAKHSGFSERVVNHVISLNPRMAKRTYSTATGGQIINCKAYRTESFMKAMMKFYDASDDKGDYMNKNGEFEYYDPNWENVANSGKG